MSCYDFCRNGNSHYTVSRLQGWLPGDCTFFSLFKGRLSEVYPGLVAVFCREWEGEDFPAVLFIPTLPPRIYFLCASADIVNVIPGLSEIITIRTTISSFFFFF